MPRSADRARAAGETGVICSMPSDSIYMQAAGCPSTTTALHAVRTLLRYLPIPEHGPYL